MVEKGLRYHSDKEYLIQEARKAGLDTLSIIKVLARNEPYGDVKQIAKEWAPLLGVTELEFVRVAFPIRKRL